MTRKIKNGGGNGGGWEDGLTVKEIIRTEETKEKAVQLHKSAVASGSPGVG